MPTKQKMVAPTFDDYPDVENTPALLALLAARTAPFFCIGNRAAHQPELLKRIATAGHEIENHTFFTSRPQTFFPCGDCWMNWSRAQAEIQRVTGRAPEFFRPPVSLTNPRIFRVTGESA